MNFSKTQMSIITASEPRIICLSSAASGKAIPNSTVIPTPIGPRRVDEIKEGDYLFDRYGKPTKVLGVYPQGKKEVFEVTFGDKRTARCCDEHIWYVHKKGWANKERYEEFTVKQMLEIGLVDNRRAANFSIPVAKAVEYDEKDYAVPPYVVGAFLGDGSCKEDRLAFSSADENMVEHIADLLKCSYKKRSDNNFTWDFYIENKGGLHTRDVLPQELINYSYDKFIPDEYKYGSIEQRLELVRGLMDTDGSIVKDKRPDHAATATVSFTSTSPRLINDMVEVLGSLGYIVTIHKDKREEKYTTGACYELKINIPNEEKEKLFWLPRKKEIALSVKDKPLKKNHSVTSIRSIESLGYEEEMTCFYVDNAEHVFLTENFVVTHNTRVLTERIRNLVEAKNVKPEDIVAITFTNAAAQEMRQRLGSISDNMFIGTIHSYANKICSMNGVDTISDINKQEFDKILEKVMKIPKAKYPKVQHLLVDECQDMTLLVFDFVNKIPSENIFLVGDTRQTIYTFNGSSDSYMRAIYNSQDFKSYNLAENYRNPPNIIDYAEEFLSSNKFTEIGPKSIPVKKREGIIEKRTFSEVIDYIAQDKNWGSWFVLTRTNAELDKAVEILADNDIPCFAFRKHELDLDGVQDALLRNCVKVMTIHTSKGLQAKNVAVIGARTYNVDERRISYVAATRAESALFWCPTVVKKGYGKSKSSKKPKNLTFFTDGGNGIIQF